VTHIHLENDHYNGGGGNGGGGNGGGGGVCMHVYYEPSTLFSRQHTSVIFIQRQDLVCIFWHVHLFFLHLLAILSTNIMHTVFLDAYFFIIYLIVTLVLLLSWCLVMFSVGVHTVLCIAIIFIHCRDQLLVLTVDFSISLLIV